MGTTTSSTAAHRAFRNRGTATRTSVGGGRHRSHRLQPRHRGHKVHPGGHLRASAEEVNKIMPRSPSLAMKSQVARRKLWMLAARNQGASLTRAQKFSNIISKLEKKLLYIDRQQCREDFRKSLGQIFNGRSCVECTGLNDVSANFSLSCAFAKASSVVLSEHSTSGHRLFIREPAMLSTRF